MRKIKKVIFASATAVVVAAVTIGGTMAYLSSQDQDANVMTLGNVHIEQVEQERDENGLLTQFKQAKPAYPAVYEQIAWDDDKVEVNGAEYKVFDEDMKNIIDKIVTVNNTGKSKAYVRTIVAIEAPDGDPNNLIHFSYNEEGVKVSEGFVTEINGVDYYVIAFTYDEALMPGENSVPSLMQLFLGKEATNEECEKFGNSWEVLVLSQAIQTNGFDTAATALDEGFGKVTEANAKTWFGEASIPALVKDADGLVEALASNKDVVLETNVKIEPAKMSNAYGTTGINIKNGQMIDGAGKVLNIKGAGGTWDSGINTTGGLIKDITVTGSFRGIFINHNSSHSERVVLENVIIDGTTYTISCDQGLYQGLTATNSTFNGWTSYAETLGDALFVDCNFGYGNGYRFCRPYAKTQFVGCEFEVGYQIEPIAAVTFENCTIGGEPLTKSNLATLVISNIQNATVK